MFKVNSSSSLDAMESGVFRAQIPSECIVDLSIQMPELSKCSHETMTWTFRERSLDPPSCHSVVSTQNHSHTDSTISRSFALSTKSSTSTDPSTLHSFSTYTDCSAKPTIPNKLPSPCSDSVNIPPSVFYNSRRQEDFKVCISPKSAQCDVDFPSWNPKEENLNKTTTGGFPDQTLSHQEDYSAKMPTKYPRKFLATNTAPKNLSKRRSEESSVCNGTLPTSIVKVKSEVSPPNRKQDQVFESTVLDGFAVVSTTQTIPLFDTRSISKQSIEASPDQVIYAPTINTPQNEKIRNPQDGFAKVRKQTGAPHRSSTTKDFPKEQGETLLDGFAAGLRSRLVHQESQEGLRTGGVHNGTSMFNICETTHRPPQHKEQHFSFVEYTIGTQHTDLRVSKKPFSSPATPRGRQRTLLALRVVFVTCVAFALFFSVRRPRHAPTIVLLFLCFAAISAILLLSGIFSSDSHDTQVPCEDSV